MGKVKAIAFADIHWNNWNMFSPNDRRLMLNHKIFAKISEECTRHGCPALFPGDMFHDDESLPNRVLSEFVESYNKYFEIDSIPFISIDGNHDQDGVSYPDKIPYNYSKTFSRVFKTFHHCSYDCYTEKELRVYGIPYLTGNKGFEKEVDKIKIKDKSKLNILLIHSDLINCFDTDGREVPKGDNISDTILDKFKKFDWVLSGHIHKPQKLSRNTIMLGATHQQNKGDRGCEMGYWKIYQDKVKFVKLGMPEFWPLIKDQEPPDDYHFYYKIPEKVKDVDIDIKSDISDAKGLVKEYCKIRGVKDKRKINTLISLMNG